MNRYEKYTKSAADDAHSRSVSSGTPEMKKLIGSAAIVATLLVAFTARGEHEDEAMDRRSHHPITIAVFGDWPYSIPLLNSADLLINSINSDPEVSLVMHVGDTHSGAMPCTGAGLDPRPAGAAPHWNEDIFKLFERFSDPMVYTPGDNEWVDCHQPGELGSGAPLNELAAVRSIFFPESGVTLGMHKRRVLTQAKKFNRIYPSDAQYVENVMWQQSGVVFVVVNMPGSNNDGVTWTAPFTDETARTREAAQRTGAAIRWLQKAFARAEDEGAKALVIGLQANMWVQGGSNFSLFVHELANLSLHFGRPVLLLNGDTHTFFSDKPLADPNSTTGRIHGAPAVPNLTRITVQGALIAPSEWLRLTIDPHAAEVFTWQNVPYCATPAVACP